MAEPDRLALAIESGELRLPDAGDVVVLNAAPLRFLDLLDRDRLRCVQNFRPLHDALAARGFAVATEAQPPAGAVLVLMGRARAASQALVARALELLEPGGLLVVSGDKTQGCDALARAVASASPLEGQFIKAHGRAFWLRAPETTPGIFADWARAGATARNGLGHFTAPGMFSPDHPDPGSLALAEHLGGKLRGRIADLGAGWGWLAAEALRANPGIEHLDLYEADAAALDAARLNVLDARAGFHWADVTRLTAPAERYDAVIMNPPFHQGRAAEPDIGAAFIAAAARILKPSGRLLMVANRQLPYEAALEQSFQRVERLHQDGFYKVIAARQPRKRT